MEMWGQTFRRTRKCWSCELKHAISHFTSVYRCCDKCLFDKSEGLTNEVHLDSVGLLRIKEYTKSKKCKAIKAKHVAS
jgi:hypothetical protein